MATVLLTGFEPFGGDTANPSGDAVRLIGAEWDEPHELIVEVLPVTFAGAAERLRELVTAHHPDIVIATGLAGGSTTVRVERIAVNLVDARIPDNAGQQPIDRPSAEHAPNAYFSTLPVKEIAAAIRGAGIPAEVSHTAGTFVCNHAFFTALDAVAPRTRAGFLHVPWSVEAAPPAPPGVPLVDIAHAVRIAIEVSLTPSETQPSSEGGTLH